MVPSPRRSFVAALSLLAVVAGSCLVCLQAERAFDVTVRTESPGGFALHVEPHGAARCLTHLLATAVR